MIVTLAGCGALGSLLAARLLEGGQTVQVYQRRGAQFDALRERGITVLNDRGTGDRSFRLAAVSDTPQGLQPSALVIVLVKSYATVQILPVASILEAQGRLLTLQNGLGNAETLVRALGTGQVMAGIATYGAYQVSPGVIRWGGEGRLVLGPWQAEAAAPWVAGFLQAAGLQAEDVPDPRPALWRKLTMNAMVNPTAALTGLNNAQMLAAPQAVEMMRHLLAEAVEAANRAGMNFVFDELWEAHLLSLRHTAANKPSMLQDVLAGRPTEVDAISGSVLAYARSETDFPYTRAVYALLKARDEGV